MLIGNIDKRPLILFKSQYFDYLVERTIVKQSFNDFVSMSQFLESVGLHWLLRLPGGISPFIYSTLTEKAIPKVLSSTSGIFCHLIMLHSQPSQTSISIYLYHKTGG